VTGGELEGRQVVDTLRADEEQHAQTEAVGGPEAGVDLVGARARHLVDGGDAAGMEVGGHARDRRVLLLVGGFGQSGENEVGGRLAEKAGRAAPVVADDRPALGVRRVVVDARRRQGGGAGPDGVEVAAPERDRTSAAGLVEEGRVDRVVRDPLRVPADALGPRVRVEVPDVAPYGVEDALGPSPADLHAPQPDAVVEEMQVAVAEAGQDGAAADVEDLRARAAPPENVVGVAQGEDPSLADRDGARSGRAVDGPDESPGEDEVGVHDLTSCNGGGAKPVPRPAPSDRSSVQAVGAESSAARPFLVSPGPPPGR
jgi:hypothetical protein